MSPGALVLGYRRADSEQDQTIFPLHSSRHAGATQLSNLYGEPIFCSLSPPAAAHDLYTIISLHLPYTDAESTSCVARQESGHTLPTSIKTSQQGLR